jgi:hypothetical protein
MNLRIVLVAATFSLCGALRVCAEPRSISVQSGWSAPLGDLADGVRDGTYVGVSASQPIGHQQHQALLFLDVNYHVLRDKTTVLLPGYLAVRQGVRVTETAIGLRAMLRPPSATIAPYLKFGVALEFVEPKLMFDTTYQSIYISDPHFWPGFLAAVGVSVPLGASAGLRLEGMLHAIESNPTAVNVGTVGLSLWTRFAQR